MKALLCVFCARISFCAHTPEPYRQIFCFLLCVVYGLLVVGCCLACVFHYVVCCLSLVVCCLLFVVCCICLLGFVGVVNDACLLVVVVCYVFLFVVLLCDAS